MSQFKKGDRISLMVKVLDPDAVDWLTKLNVEQHGVSIRAIQIGDIFDENEKRRDWLDRLIDHYGCDGDTADDVADEMEEYEKLQCQKEEGE